jgi:hypothetical protein
MNHIGPRHLEDVMRISVSEAKAQLTELVRRAERVMRSSSRVNGQPVAQLTTVHAVPSSKRRMALLKEIQAAAAGKALPGPCAARSQDFLYDEDGLPA